MYQVRRSASGKPLNFRLCDTQGLEESQGIDAHDIAYILDGNVPDGYQVSNNMGKGIDKIYTQGKSLGNTSCITRLNFGLTFSYILKVY